MSYLGDTLVNRSHLATVVFFRKKIRIGFALLLVGTLSKIANF